VSDFPESHHDLLESSTAVLTTIGKSGIPQTTAIWFLYDEGELHSWLSDARQKVQNLLERPEFSLFILDLANPQRYLVVRGRATLTPDNDFADKMGPKYGHDMRSMLRDDETRYKVTFNPVSIAVR
jgi:PPOX class probable F420-dependent enzyme